MKKLLILSLSLVFVLGTTYAQDAKKALKQAERALSNYNLGGGTDGAKLEEAVEGIEAAIKSDEYAGMSKTWSTRGQIYNAIVSNHMAMKLIDTSHEILDAQAAFKGFESFKKALSLAVKKWEKRDALKGLSEAASNLNNLGIGSYEVKDYAGAYKNFNAMLEVHDLLKENNEASPLDVGDDYNNQLYITGLAAMYDDNLEAATPLFIKLKEAGFDKPSVYDALYKINAESDPEKAAALLTEGREKFPDDTGLLFTEINHYLKAGQMDVLENKLIAAIEAEPENVSLYYTLGRVYLDTDRTDKALEQYNRALEVKPGYYEALYGIGEMYYNKAAKITQEMKSLEDKYDKASLKKYDELREKMVAEFDNALPYFKKAEAQNPNDRNTIIALKEIFAKKNELEMSQEFDKRLKTVDGGGTNESSYFKE